MLPQIEKDRGYKDEHHDYIQQQIRRFCLKCIFAPGREGVGRGRDGGGVGEMVGEWGVGGRGRDGVEVGRGRDGWK